jgi:hypothetical protein
MTAATTETTHFRCGHPADEENTYTWPRNGTRQCRTCSRLRSARRRKEHPDKASESRRRWRDANAAKIRAYRKANRDADRERIRERNRRLRAETIAAYGGRCVLCGTTEELELDHVRDDGSVHRQRVGQSIYGDLKRRSWPPVVALLCRADHRGQHGRHGKGPRLMPVAMVEALCALTKPPLCLVCGRTIVGLRADARYCGPTCKMSAYRARAAR